jgi:cupin superfamily acireductone dioxygenase involved in methionine salvage
LATLQLADGNVLVEFSQIEQELFQLDIQLDSYPCNKSPQLLKLLSKPHLSDAEKKKVLRFYDSLLETLKAKNHYVISYLLVFYAIQLDQETQPVFSKNFDRHSTGEGYYVLDGKCILGFTDFWSKPLELTLQAEEHIAIPPGTKYWFRLPDDQCLKLIRYFANPEPSSSNHSVFHTTDVYFDS